MATFGFSEGCPACLGTLGEPCYKGGSKCCQMMTAPARKEDDPAPTELDMQIRAKFTNENPIKIQERYEVDALGEMGDISATTWGTMGVGVLGIGLSLWLPKNNRMIPLSTAIGAAFLAHGLLSYGYERK